LNIARSIQSSYIENIMRSLLFLILLCVVFSWTTGLAQVGLKSIPKSEIKENTNNAFYASNTFQIINSLEKYNTIEGTSDDLTMNIEQPPIGMFCKLDKSMDQKLPFQMRFRLGEYHYTNGLEYGDELGRRAANELIETIGN